MKAKLTLFLLFLLACSACLADEQNSLWLTSGMWSRHPNEDHYHYNQHNQGVGISYHIRNYQLVAGEYDNSLRHNSDYFGLINEPYKIGPIKIGYVAGFVSGYTKTPKFYPAAAPMLSYEFDNRVGINLIVVPSVVTAAQLTVRLW